MTIHVYIVGTAHSIQCGNTEKSTQEKIAAFCTEIRGIYEQYGIKRIAEEMSRDGLKRQCVEKTLGNRIADDYGICHHHVDLERSERTKLSLDDSLQSIEQRNLDVSNTVTLSEGIERLGHEVRERVWIARMISRNTWPVLFICGSDHSANVHELFRHIGMSAEILHDDFDP